MFYGNAYKGWETTQRHSQTARLQTTVSKGTFFFSVQHLALCLNSDVRFIVAGDITCHKSIVVQQSVFLYSLQWHSRNALLWFHSNWLRERAAVSRCIIIAHLLGFSPSCSAHRAAVNKSCFRSDCVEPELVSVVAKLRLLCCVHSDCRLFAIKTRKPFCHKTHNRCSF